MIDQLEAYLPGVREHIETIDVATPVTTERYTGNAQYYPANVGVGLLDLFSGKANIRTLPGLKSCYLVGQWAGFPGLPFVAGMGRRLIQFMCKQDGKRFGMSHTDNP